MRRWRGLRSHGGRRRFISERVFLRSRGFVVTALSRLLSGRIDGNAEARGLEGVEEAVPVGVRCV